MTVTDIATTNNDPVNNKEEETTNSYLAAEEGTADANTTDNANNNNANTNANNNNNNSSEPPNADDGEQPPSNKNAYVKKIIVGVILLALIVFVIVDSLTNQWVRTGILAFLEWIENNLVAGIFGFMAVYFVATICFVPGSILTLGAGFVFSASFDSLGLGVALGTAAVFIGASLGAIASFLLGRYLFRDGCVGRLTEKYTIVKALDNALTDKGLRIMILLRLCPLVPFNVLNYVAGVTGVRFWHYVVACFGMLPGTVVYVFLGASAGSLAEIGGDGGDGDGDGDGDDSGSNKVVTVSVLVAGAVFGILAIGVTSYYAKQELNKVLKEKETEDEQNGTGNKSIENIENENAGTAEEEISM